MQTLGRRPATGMAFALLALATTSGAAGIAVLGNCQATVGPRWLLQATRARSGLVYKSDPAQILVNVSGMSSQLAGWRVEVRREGGAWPQGVRLWVRRTGDGIGSGRVSGPLTFTEITPTGTLLCIGQGERTGIPFQLRITGLSFDLPVGTHMAGVSYGLITIGE